jgi:hypothetical protein
MSKLRCNISISLDGFVAGPTVSTISWSRNVQHHPEHEIEAWVARESNPERSDEVASG